MKVLVAGSGSHVHTLFLNFDGGPVAPARSGDAHTGKSDLIVSSCVVPPFDPRPFGDDRTAVTARIAKLVGELFTQYALEVTTARPPDSEPYVMAMIGGSAYSVDAPPSSRGYAPLDCNDTNSNDVVFVFSDALGADFPGNEEGAMYSVAVVAAQEAAHAYGLTHTDNEHDVMYPYIESPAAAQRFAGGKVIGGSCSPELTFQDSAAMLMGLLGPR